MKLTSILTRWSALLEVQTINTYFTIINTYFTIIDNFTIIAHPIPDLHTQDLL